MFSQVRLARAAIMSRRHGEALRLRLEQRLRDEHRQVRLARIAALPEREATVVVLHLRQLLDVDVDAALHRGRARQILRS